MEIKVYETRKYSVFKKLEGNRDLCSVKKIVDSINKVVICLFSMSII